MNRDEPDQTPDARVMHETLTVLAIVSSKVHLLRRIAEHGQTDETATIANDLGAIERTIVDGAERIKLLDEKLHEKGIVYLAKP